MVSDGTISRNDLDDTPSATIAAAAVRQMLNPRRVLRVPHLSTRMPPKKGRITFGALQAHGDGTERWLVGWNVPVNGIQQLKVGLELIPSHRAGELTT